MKYSQNLMANAIAGAILGSIFLLPYLGWLYSGHGIIMLDWTKKFLIVGIVWGVLCGTVIGILPIMMKSSIKRRIVTGMIIGGLSGMVFYLIGNLAFPSTDSLSATLIKSLWGLGCGIMGGGISALMLGGLHWLLKWIKISDESNYQNKPENKSPFREKVFSAFVGLNAGSFIGNFILVLIGQVLMAMYGAVYYYQIFWVYLLPIILACFATIYLFIKPLQKQHLRKIMDGLRYGIIFSLLSLLYFSALILLMSALSAPEPELMRGDSFSEFFMGVIGVFTFGFGFACGITGASVEEFITVARVKLRTTA